MNRIFAAEIIPGRGQGRKLYEEIRYFFSYKEISVGELFSHKSYIKRFNGLINYHGDQIFLDEKVMPFD